MVGIFSDTGLQKTAAGCGFYKKKSDFMPAMFFDILMYCASETEPCSLEHMASILSEFYGIKISKQSIDERFNIKSIDFVKKILTEVLEKQLSKIYDARFLPEYTRILIKDSTRFNLPERLSEYYRGSGGSKGTSNAAVCIQFEYDVVNGKVYSLEITRGSRNDQTDAKETVAEVKSGDLILRDLGYYSLPILSKIADAGAFFISRFGTKTKAYDAETHEEISFKNLYAYMTKNHMSRIEKNIYASRTHQMPLRMIIETVSNEVYQKRLKKIDKYNKSHGYSTSDDYKAQCRFNIFITNIEPENLSAEEVVKLYRLRWQIELMFKNWKSICKMDEIQAMKYERFTCLLYAKLILIIINLQIIWNLRRYFHAGTGQSLSMVKCLITLQRNFTTVYRILKEKSKASENYLHKISRILSKNHWKEERKNRVNFEDLLRLFICRSAS